MGWASASLIMNEIIDGIMPEVETKDARKRIYKPIIEALENGDWDTQDECLGTDEAFDEVIKEMHPHWFEEE